MANKDDEDGSPVPTPDEITRKLADFMKSNFGDSVSFQSSVMPSFGGDESTAETESEPPAPRQSDDRNIFEFNLHPRDIKAHLDRYVIRQEEAKKVLSIAVCDHYNHAKYLRRLAKSDPEKARQTEFTKQNVIVVGPTGVGKTYLVKHIADLIGVPFVKADATKFSETGYVGADVDDLVRELVRKADGDVELAEYGIIYIDEVDKIATRGGMIGRDVSGRGVQTTLLKLMEETEVALKNPFDIQSQMQAMFEMNKGTAPTRDNVNTRHILFIVSGAFSGLEKIINDRMRQGSIGFAAESRDVPGEDESLREVQTQDFIDFGFEAEFIGRLPVRVVCEHLDAGDLFDIMKTSEGSVIRQYEREFEAFGIKANFEDDALKQISETAAQEKTGARGLMTVCERTLRDFKFELPGTAVTELTIDRELVDHPGPVLERYREAGAKFCDSKIVSELASFRRQFHDEHGVQLAFDPEAIAALGAMSESQNMSALQLCQQMFSDYQFGLKLIQKNTESDFFMLPKAAIENPERYLSELVVASFGGRESKSDPPDGQGDDTRVVDPATDLPPAPEPDDSRPVDGGVV